MAANSACFPILLPCYTLLCWLHALAYCLCPQLSWLLLSCTIAVINVYMCVHITNTYWYTLDVYIIRSCDVYIIYIAADCSCGRTGKIFWAVVCVEGASHEHMEVRPWLAGVLKHHPGGRASPSRRKDCRQSRSHLGLEEKTYGEMPRSLQKGRLLPISTLW